MKKLILTLALLIGSIPAMAQEKTEWLTPVEAQYVCMMNDKAFDKVQIPVEVDGKTYYGCCSMCEAHLKKNDVIRKAIDPVSGNEVSKAEAVIAADKNDKVYYFENSENLKTYTENNKPETSESMNHDMHKGMDHGDMKDKH